MVGHFQEFEDEYLETMYEFYEHDPLQRVRTGDLASRLGVAPASATEMIQRLAEIIFRTTGLTVVSVM